MIFSLINYPLILLASVVGFLFIGLPLHEFAHAYIANRLGDPTAKLEGRLTLNPLAHLDPLGTVFFLLIGFGWGKPVPINPNYFHNKKDELKVSIAGIVSNLVIAGVFGIPIRLALLQGQIIDSSVLLTFIDVIVVVNIMLAVFNILPIPPLDGSHFLEYFLTEEQKYTFQMYGQYILLGIILLGLISGFSIIWLIMDPLIRILHAILTGIPMNAPGIFF